MSSFNSRPSASSSSSSTVNSRGWEDDGSWADRSPPQKVIKNNSRSVFAPTHISSSSSSSSSFSSSQQSSPLMRSNPFLLNITSANTSQQLNIQNKPRSSSSSSSKTGQNNSSYSAVSLATRNEGLIRALISAKSEISALKKTINIMNLDSLTKTFNPFSTKKGSDYSQRCPSSDKSTQTATIEHAIESNRGGSSSDNNASSHHLAAVLDAQASHQFRMAMPLLTAALDAQFPIGKSGQQLVRNSPRRRRKSNHTTTVTGYGDDIDDNCDIDENDDYIDGGGRVESAVRSTGATMMQSPVIERVSKSLVDIMLLEKQDEYSYLREEEEKEEEAEHRQTFHLPKRSNEFMKSKIMATSSPSVVSVLASRRGGESRTTAAPGGFFGLFSFNKQQQSEHSMKLLDKHIETDEILTPIKTSSSMNASFPSRASSVSTPPRGGNVGGTAGVKLSRLSGLQATRGGQATISEDAEKKDEALLSPPQQSSTEYLSSNEKSPRKANGQALSITATLLSKQLSFEDVDLAAMTDNEQGVPLGVPLGVPKKIRSPLAMPTEMSTPQSQASGQSSRDSSSKLQQLLSLKEKIRVQNSSAFKLEVSPSPSSLPSTSHKSNIPRSTMRSSSSARPGFNSPKINLNDTSVSSFPTFSSKDSRDSRGISEHNMCTGSNISSEASIASNINSKNEARSRPMNSTTNTGKSGPKTSQFFKLLI